MEVPTDRSYTTTHEWARPEGAEVVVGITAHAQEELRDVVYVELPQVGRAVTQGEPVAVIESVKAAFDIYSPVSGTIARVNEALAKSPQQINQDCYGAGWLFAVTGSLAPDTLLTADAYRRHIEAETY